MWITGFRWEILLVCWCAVKLPSSLACVKEHLMRPIPISVCRSESLEWIISSRLCYLSCCRGRSQNRRDFESIFTLQLQNLFIAHIIGHSRHKYCSYVHASGYVLFALQYTFHPRACNSSLISILSLLRCISISRKEKSLTRSNSGSLIAATFSSIQRAMGLSPGGPHLLILDCLMSTGPGVLIYIVCAITHSVAHQCASHGSRSALAADIAHCAVV